MGRVGVWGGSWFSISWPGECGEGHSLNMFRFLIVSNICDSSIIFSRCLILLDHAEENVEKTSWLHRNIAQHWTRVTFLYTPCGQGLVDVRFYLISIKEQLIMQLMGWGVPDEFYTNSCLIVTNDFVSSCYLCMFSIHFICKVRNIWHESPTTIPFTETAKNTNRNKRF
jgi:hypothetical protein